MSADSTVVDSTPRTTPEPPSIDISPCIFGYNIRYLKVLEPKTISYLQQKHPLHSPDSGFTSAHRGNDSTQRSPDPSYSSGFSHSTSHVYSEHQSKSSWSAKKTCFINFQAPQNTVLSFLFLRQTCSHDNNVTIDDPQIGSRVTFDGCSPWKSPGYDLTTSYEFVSMHITMTNFTQFYNLKIRVTSVKPFRPPAMSCIRYVSPHLGYIQTAGWHPFDEPARYDYVYSNEEVVAPLNHKTLISVVYLYVIRETPRNVPRVTLFKTTKPGKIRRTVWRHDASQFSVPDHVLLTDVTKFQVLFSRVLREFFGGCRLLFSFHPPSLEPYRHKGGLWNCSSPSWPDVYLHFRCNNKVECLDKKDEMQCPDMSCSQGGTLLSGSCYFFKPLTNGASWQDANTACRQLDATLASFPTVNSWYHFALLTQNEWRGIFFGLESVDADFPHMYHYQLRWTSGSIAYYYRYYTARTRPYCSIAIGNYIFLRSCTGTVSNDVVALCLISSYGVKKKEKWQVGAALIHNSYDQKLVQPLSETGQACWNRSSLLIISCPSQFHRTHKFLACDAASACWFGYDTKSDDVNNTKDVYDYDTEILVCSGTDSFKALFTCKNGISAVPYSLVCDLLQDCADNSDEDFCVFAPCSASAQYKCSCGQCVPFDQRCDGLVQCLDESDETDCMTQIFSHVSYEYKPRPPLMTTFDGRGYIHFGKNNCPESYILCPGDDYCLPVYVRCNGVYDCPGREDEEGCESFTCPTYYRCRGKVSICLHPDYLCDGWPQCPQHDDERFCNLTCPQNCICLGHAFNCINSFDVNLFPQLRYLKASRTGMAPEHLTNNPMIVYLNLAYCNLTRLGNLSLPNLLTLDLSDNQFCVFTISELSYLENLRNLSLARNPLSKLFLQNRSSSPVNEIIHHLDLTGVELPVLNVQTDLPFPKLLSLNLSESGLTHLAGDGFRSMTSLSTLDLRGCPMTAFPKGVFEGLKGLRRVLADNYKLCCRANLPYGFDLYNCQAPLSVVSSCDSLLRSDVYRICLYILATLSLFGNSGCFCVRVFALTGRGKTGFNVFVTHLCVSDFTMGLYLAMIGVADRLYLGNYLWEDVWWRHSTACQVAGYLALLSSEVSALIICLITLDRFLVIRFPFSRLRFAPFSAQVASLLMWTVGLGLVTVPVLPMTSHWQFYGQTGICIPLPINREDVAGDQYAFGVMILLNLVIFLLIAFGQISVYMSMMSNAMSSLDSTRKSRDLIVARRLITVVVTDFLCWFPLGLLGVLSAQGIPIPGKVNVIMAIFVLPLNSALNPFLYTLNMIQEKRRRAAEEKLLKLIMNNDTMKGIS